MACLTSNVIYGVVLNDRPAMDKALAKTLPIIWAEVRAVVCGFYVLSLKATANHH